MTNLPAELIFSHSHIGYCDSDPKGGANICYEPKKVGEACDNDDECQNSIAYCKDDKCTEKLTNGEKCPGGDDEQCQSDACGIMGYDKNGDYECCADVRDGLLHV